MPSGSKKRKAAKKKKEKEASHYQNHNQQPHSAVFQAHENDDLKHHDDKETDGEEISSPASQDHLNHEHQFTDGEKEGEKEEVEKTEDSSHVELSSEEYKSTEQLKDNGGEVEKAVVEENVFQIERELKPADEFSSNNTVAEHFEAQKESGDGAMPLVLDDVSVLENDREVKFFEELNSNNVSIESIEAQQESSNGFLPQVHNVDGESVVENEMEVKLFEELKRKDVSVDNIELHKDSSNGVLPKDNNDEPHVIDKTSVVMDNSSFASYTETVNSLSEGLSQIPNPVPAGEVYDSVAESGTDTATDNARLAGENTNICNRISGDSCLTSNVVMPGMEENGKNEVCTVDQKDSTLPIILDVGSENMREEAIVVAEDALRASDARNTMTQVTEEKLIPSYNAPKDEVANYRFASNGPDHIKASEGHEATDSQPLVASAARPVQRTSWMSCCGLFEVLAGSNR